MKPVRPLLALFLFFLALPFSLAQERPEDREMSALEFVTKGEVFYLKGPDCLTLREQATAVMIWTQDLEGKKSTGNFPACHCTSSSCFLPVNTLVSPRVLSLFLLERKTMGLGPNCWNSALWSAGVLSARRFVSDREFSLYMNSPFCSRIEEEKDLRPGDIMAIQWAPGGISAKSKRDEVHAFTYLTDKMAFSKDGSAPVSPYQFISMETLLTKFALPADCRHLSDRKYSKNCLQILRAYRCLPLARLQRDPWTDSSRKTYEQLGGLEKVLELLTGRIPWTPTDTAILAEFRSKLQKIRTALSHSDEPQEKACASGFGRETLLIEKANSLWHGQTLLLGPRLF